MRKRGHHLLITTPPPQLLLLINEFQTEAAIGWECWVPRECQSLYHHCATCSPCHSIHAAFHRHHFLLDCIIFALNSSIPKMNMNTVRYCLFRQPPHFDDTLNSFNPSLSSVIVVFVVLHKNLVVVFHLACWLLCILLCWPASHHSKYYYEDFMLNLGKRRLHPPFSFN